MHVRRIYAVAPLARLTALVGMVGFLCACGSMRSPATNADVQAGIADARTSARVKRALLNHPEIGARPISIRVVRGIVQLSGRVRSTAEAELASVLARAVDGVHDVRSDLQIDAALTTPPLSPPVETPRDDARELEANPILFAAGVSLGATAPRAERLHTRIAVSPLFKLGSGRGLGVAIGFDWFQADVQSAPGQDEPITRVHVKPIMLGLGYTIGSERMSLAPSIVGGYAFNSLTVTDVGAAAALPVEVGNSLAWRVGASAWFDVSRRFAINVSGGYLMTGLRLTVLDGGRLVRRDTRGDTALVHAGLAYKIF
jgi:hypothetical protein